MRGRSAELPRRGLFLLQTALLHSVMDLIPALARLTFMLRLLPVFIVQFFFGVDYAHIVAAPLHVDATLVADELLRSFLESNVPGIFREILALVWSAHQRPLVREDGLLGRGAAEGVVDTRVRHGVEGEVMALVGTTPGDLGTSNRNGTGVLDVGQCLSGYVLRELEEFGGLGFDVGFAGCDVLGVVEVGVVRERGTGHGWLLSSSQ